jgi:diguanylate cyclase (GGDEF)-like protein
MNCSDLPVVLIVDDDRINRTVLAELLQQDCRLLLAKDGPSALQRIAEEDVMLVLLDISMPGMDGYEVLRRMKADRRTADISVIFITGQTDEAAEERGLMLGAVDYVSKPIRPAIVRARVRAHLRSAQQRRALASLSAQDALTGLANRRHFDEALDRACRHAARSGETMGLAMLDVDHFKQYNDHYGHGAGDDALCQVARILTGIARRPHDLAARYGGEEFVLIMQQTGDFAHRLDHARQEIMALRIPHAHSGTAPVLTISGGGVVARVPRDASTTAPLLLREADALLYRAKHAGRNRVLTEALLVRA